MFYPSKAKKGGSKGGNSVSNPNSGTEANGAPGGQPKEGSQAGEVRHTGPKQKTPTQLEQIPYYKEPLEGMPTLPPCPTEGTPCDAAHSRKLANRKTEEKEPTRVVNLRRRLLRILTTRDRIMEAEGQPDSRQLSALNAEAPIVWEIDQWEEHRLIYPGKEEQRWLPPNSLTPHLQNNPQDRDGSGSVTTTSGHNTSSTGGDTEGSSSRSSSGGPMARAPVMPPQHPQPPTEGQKWPAEATSKAKGGGRGAGGGSKGEIATTNSHVEVWMQTVSQESVVEEWHQTSRPLHPTPTPPTPTPTSPHHCPPPHGGHPNPNSNLTPTHSAHSSGSSPFPTTTYGTGPVFVPSSHPPPPPAYRSLPRPPYPQGPPRQEECGGVSGAAGSYPGPTSSGSNVEECEAGGGVGSLSGPMSPGKQVGSYGGMYGHPSGYQFPHPQQQMFVAPMVHDYDAFHIPPHSIPHSTPPHPSKPPSLSLAKDCPPHGATPTAPPTEEQHSLENTWSVWFDNSPVRGQGGHGRVSVMDRQSYEDSLQMAGTFSTIQGFWAFWNNVGVEHLRDNFNLKIFRYGIRPTWEDCHNSRGGRWVARGLNRSRRQNLWLTVVLNMVGELLEDNTADTVNGAVLSTKDSQGDSVQIWTDGGYQNRKGDETIVPEYRAANPSMQEVLKEMYASEQEACFTYSPHGTGKGGGGPGSPGGRRRGNGGRANNRKDGGATPQTPTAGPGSPKLGGQAPSPPGKAPSPLAAPPSSATGIPGAHAPSPSGSKGGDHRRAGGCPQPPLDLLVPLEGRA